MLCGWRAQPIVDAGAPWVIATGVLGAAAMGVQNAAGRLVFSDLAPTTVMTGNVTQLVLDVVELLRAGATDAGSRQRVRKLFWPIVAFACGALCGAFVYAQASLWALALPLSSSPAWRSRCRAKAARTRAAAIREAVRDPVTVGASVTPLELRVRRRAASGGSPAPARAPP
jgi:hypothetical protein